MESTCRPEYNDNKATAKTKESSPDITSNGDPPPDLFGSGKWRATVLPQEWQDRVDWDADEEPEPGPE